MNLLPHWTVLIESPTACRDYIIIESERLGNDFVGPLLEPNMKTQTASQPAPKAAATVAGEDLACGDYVALLNETVDFPSFLWDAINSPGRSAIRQGT